MKKSFIKINKMNIFIIGLGYLGYSNLVNFSSKGLIININDFGNKIDRTKLTNKLIYPTYKIKNEFENIDTKKMNFNNIVKIQTNKIFKKKNALIFLCNSELINSNKINLKFVNMLNLQKNNIKKNKPVFVVEFVNAPGKINNDFIYKLNKINLKINKDYSLIYAPRDDWNFNDINKNIYRSVWSSNENSFKIFENLINLFNKRIYKVDNLLNLEVISNLKNSIEHISNILINQISLSYPNISVAELTNHFNNLNKTNLSISGIGSMGLRLPSSSLNLLNGSQNSEKLTILKEAIHTDFSLFKNVSSKINFNKNMKIAILGLGHHDNKSYEGISPSLELYFELKNRFREIALNDSMVNFSDYSELKKIKQFSFPKQVKNYDIIIITKDDKLYTSLSWDMLKKYLKCKVIIDTCGAWRKYNWEETKIKYLTLN